MSVIQRVPVDGCPVVTDALVHYPNVVGQYAYNGFVPPTLGNTYHDPVFCTNIRRLTDIGAAAWEGDNYSFHYVNCDGTLSFQRAAGAFNIINTTTGATAYSGVPSGLNPSECRWHMTDPDKYYYYSGAALMRRNLAAGTDTTIKTFPFTLTAQGGTGNYQDATNRYFCVSWNPGGGERTFVWDSQTDTTSPSGVVNWVSNSGWIAIDPSGRYLITAAGTTAPLNQEHWSYAITAGTMALGAANLYWGMGGDHSQAMYCSDGKTYVVGFELYSYPRIYRIDVSLNQAGRNEAQQIADNFLLLDVTFQDGGHFSVVSKGAYRDWVFFSTYRYANPNADVFNGATSPWYSYEGEVMAINVLTGARRRLAHHRSRCEVGGGMTYSCSPRASCSADGSYVVFASNMNDSAPTGYADLYGIANPLTSP